MIKIKIKKFITVGIILLAGIFLFAGHFDKYNRFTHAEEEEEEEEDEREEREDREDIPSPVPPAEKPKEDKKEEAKIEYKTIYRQLPPTVVETPVTTVRRDSDGDGLYDDEDAHPGINDYFIVKDDNQNGVDDRYEQQSTPA